MREEARNALGRWGLLLVALLGIATLILQLKDQPMQGGFFKVEDFGAYWSATRVYLRGGNPYDREQLRPLQQSIDPQRADVLPAWGPPWSFLVLAPLGYLDFAPARALWLLVQAALLILSVELLRRSYPGLQEDPIKAWWITFTFYPTLQLLGLGQLSVLTLLGLCASLYFLEKQRRFSAGLCATLTLVKPHTVILFWCGVAVWSIRNRRYAVLAGMTAMTAGTALVLTLVNPRVFPDYWAAFTNRPPAELLPPTVGSLLRLVMGETRLVLSFAPLILGLTWIVWRVRSQGEQWNWSRELPTITFACILTMPYGWVYDMVILLAAWIPLLVGVQRNRPGFWILLGLHLGINGLALFLNLLRVDEMRYLWFPMVLLGVYLIYRPRSAAMV